MYKKYGSKLPEEMDYFVLYFTFDDYGTEQFTIMAYRKQIGYSKEKSSRGYRKFFHGNNIINVLCEAIKYFYGEEVKEKEINAPSFEKAKERLQEFDNYYNKLEKLNLLDGCFFNITCYFSPQTQTFYMARIKMNSTNFETVDNLNKSIFTIGKYMKKSSSELLQNIIDSMPDTKIKLTDGLYFYSKEEKIINCDKKKLNNLFNEMYPEIWESTPKLSNRKWLTKYNDPNPKYTDEYTGFIKEIIDKMFFVFKEQINLYKNKHNIEVST